MSEALERLLQNIEGEDQGMEAEQAATAAPPHSEPSIQPVSLSSEPAGEEEPQGFSQGKEEPAALAGKKKDGSKALIAIFLILIILLLVDEFRW